MRNYKHIPLSHDELQRMLKQHKTYKMTEGKEGLLIDLSGYVVEGFDFSGLDLSSTNARVSVFTRCNFADCDLYGVSFSESSLIEADFSNSIMIKTEFFDVDATKACFDNAKMTRAEFIGTSLRQATFRNADLHSATITECDLTSTVFDDASIEYAAVSDNIEDCTSWKNVKGWKQVAA